MFDDQEELPVIFVEDLPEHAINDNIRAAFVWAALNKFIDDPKVWEDINIAAFDELDKKMSKNVMFLGPFSDEQVALNVSRKCRGIVCLPKNMWTTDTRPAYVATLAN